VVVDNAILLEAFIYCYDPAYYARFRGKNAFLVHFQDETYAGHYHLYENFRGVFRNFWSGIFNPSFVRFFPLGATVSLHRPLPEIKRATEREYVWSFLGQASKASRPDMARALLEIEPHLFFSTDDVPGTAMFNRTDAGPRRYSPEEYTRILLESIFSPSPMGNVNIECYRVYEALECGSIPIVEKRLTLDYYTKLLGENPLPAVSSWAEARSFLRKMVASPGEMDRLQERCIAWWQRYKIEYSQRVGEFLAERSRAGAEPVHDAVSGVQRIPGWQTVELLRHHDLPAFSRRITRQVKRLVSSGKLRESYRPGVRLD
jgi:hypothetical protein